MKLRKEEEEEEKGEKEQEQEEEEEGRREGGGKTPGSRKKQSELCMCGGEREHPVTETLSALKTKRKEQGLGPGSVAVKSTDWEGGVWDLKRRYRKCRGSLVARSIFVKGTFYE